jgi:ABC-type glycerol-3-phosphate transport system substrate-binding protein
MRSMPKNLTQKQIVIIGIAAVVVVILAVVFFINIRGGGGASTATLNITIWGTDDAKVFHDLISAYSGPGAGNSMEVKYTQIDPTTYRETLLTALAAGTGPDIFEIGNRDLPQWSNLVTPIPTSLATTFNAVTLQNDFPTVVGQDFVINNNVYALPLSVDTLAMLYNKDIMDSAGIAVPPKTWTEFESDVPTLRSVNMQGQITRAAAALGGSGTSIANASDIVFLMMLQNGTQMTGTDNSTVSFMGNGGETTPGLLAFNFYLQFANAGSPYYTWNNSMGDSRDSFAQGKTAIIFDYASSLAAIKTKAPFLNIGIAPMPQPDNATLAINYPNYSGLAVNKNSASALGAWNFLINLTTSLANEKIYTADTGEPPALRTAIQADLTDPNLSVFAAQALTARSWHENNSVKFDGIMNTAIQDVLNGSSDSTNALTEAQSQMNGAGN